MKLGTLAHRLCVAGAVISLATEASASAAPSEPGAGERRSDRPHLAPSLDVFLVPTYYRYAESFSSIPVDTDWSAPALGVGFEAKIHSGIPLVPKLGASFLASLPSEETNSSRLRTSQMHVAYFVDASPGVELEAYRSPRITAALAFDWTFLFYEQSRDFTPAISESVFFHGPSVGARLEGFLTERIGLAASYRHQFLVWGSVSNSRFVAGGYETPSANGDRDVLRPAVLFRTGDASFVHLGYRLESIRVRGTTVSNGSSTLEYPDNVHAIHGIELGLDATFR